MREAVFELRDKGHDVQVRITYESSDTERYVKEALAMGSDTIVAAGGDGSVNETAQALIDLDAPSDTAFAVIPLGTANDFANGLSIPLDPRDALLLAATDTARPIDVGLVNDKVFVNVATGGFGAEVTESTDKGLKDSLGGAAYILTGLLKPHTISAKEATAKMPLEAQVCQDGEWVGIKGMDHSEIKAAKDGSKDYAEFTGDLLVLAVGNSRQAGGGVQLCPDAQVDDGLLDVTYVINPPLQQIPNILGDLANDKRLDGPKGSIRCKWLEVVCPDELQINRDGEPMRAKSFTFKVLPQRLALHVSETELFSKSGGVDSPRAPARKQLSRKIEARQQRREQFTAKRVATHPVARTMLKASVLVGIGVGIGAKMQQHRMLLK